MILLSCRDRRPMRRWKILSNRLKRSYCVCSVSGRVISEDELPRKDLQISAYDKELSLTQTSTNWNGYFRIPLSSHLKTPGVRLIIKDEEGKKILKIAQPKTSQTTAEIDYHIRVVCECDVPDKDVLDIYSGNAQRFIERLIEVGSEIEIEHKINLNILNNTSPPQDIKKTLQKFVDGYDESRANFSHFLVIMSALVDTRLEQLHLEDIGYDGPQVPRMPRRESYQQVITWPRKEKFKWA
jgi:hypothetical protein